jgi:hypothetical protein
MSVAVGDKLLSFLAHRCERPGGRESVSPSTMNPGFFTSNGVIRNSRLQDIVNDRVLGVGDLGKLRFALVDLTGEKLNRPEFAGHRDLEQGGVGSMAKLACMYAIYQLQFDLQHFLTIGSSPPEEKRFFAGMREFWRISQLPIKEKKVTNIFPARPRIDLVPSIVGSLVRVDGRFIPIPRPYSSPDLEEMFKIENGVVRFKGGDQTKVDLAAPPRFGTLSQEARAYQARFAPDGNLTEARKLTFADRLFLMIDDSDNPCSHTCIENVSFLYITSSIWQADIYRPERGGGLWEGNNQDPGNKFAWKKPPVPQGNPKADFVSGTPASIAALFTLMEQDRLVGKNACINMRHLTDRRKSDIPGGSFNRSFFQDGLKKAVIFPERIHAKIGIGDARDDSALIVRDVDPTPRAPVRVRTRIRYVAVGCDDVAGVKELHDLIVRLDTCIRENNGLMTKQDA